jgi:hypothetical protein
MDGAVQLSQSDAAQCNDCPAVGPGSSQEIEQRITGTVADIIRWVRGDCDALRLCGFEESLWSNIALLYRLFVALFLAVRHERLDVQPHLAGGRYRLKDRFAERTVKTFCGLVAYGRAYLHDERTGHGWFPLDALLGITQDGFSLRVIGLVTRLATRVSYGAAVLLFKAFVGWAPSSEAIECLALGLGRRAGSYMEQCPPPDEEGEVLVIEIDGGVHERLDVAVRDLDRDAWFESQGYVVLRFSTRQVESDIDAVISAIRNAASNRLKRVI